MQAADEELDQDMIHSSIYSVPPGTHIVVRLLLQVYNGNDPDNTPMTTRQIVYECCVLELLLRPSIGQSIQVSSGPI